MLENNQATQQTVGATNQTLPTQNSQGGGNQATQQTVGATNQTLPTQNSQGGGNQTTPNTVFDVNNLPPEYARFLDQERTRASQTARENARKDLMRDETFINEIRGTIEPEVQQTLEQQMATSLSELQRERAETKVERLLMQANINEEDMRTYLDMLVTDDIEGSVQRATAFISTLNKTLEGRLSKQQEQALANMPTPQANGTSVTEQDRLQSDFDEAKKDTSIHKGQRMSAIMREAQQKGITLK